MLNASVYMDIDTIDGPHNGQPVLTTGAALEDAEAALILLHGRGAGAQGIIGLAGEVWQPEIAYFAPHAHNLTWYPQSFLAPLDANQPWLDSALALVDALVTHIAEAGLPAERIMLAGFSQGACLASEYVARHARRYGGLAALSGGVIGPEGTPRNDTGSLDGTPVFIGCSDVDPHIPLERVQETTQLMTTLGADVTERIYQGMGHTINEDELGHLNTLVDQLLASDSSESR